MHPWLLSDVRKDDLKARYDYADRHRLAAEFPPEKHAVPPGSPAVLLAGAGLALAGWAVAQVEVIRAVLSRPA